MDLGGTEAAVIVLNFASVFDASFATATRVVLGIPGSSSFTTANPIIRTYNAATSQANAATAFSSTPITGVTVSVFQSPSASKPHLELTVSAFSSIAAQIGLGANWDPTCLTFDAYLGSLDDMGIGEDFVGEKTTCPPPRPTPLPDFVTPFKYLNRHYGRAPINEEPVYYHPLQCQWQYQEKLTVRGD